MTVSGSRPRLLAVSHRMDRTGAPIQLASLLDGVSEELRAEIVLLQGGPGPVSETVAASVRSVVQPAPWSRWLVALAHRAPGRVGAPLWSLWRSLVRARVGPVQVVYVNSLVSHRLADPFRDLPTVVHVHEMGDLADSFGEAGRDLVRRAARVLVPSSVVADWVRQQNVEPARIQVLPGAVPGDAFVPPSADAIAEWRAILGLRSDELVVSTVGWIGALKGSDRFLRVAELLRDQLDVRVRFVWIGGGSGSGAERRFLEDRSSRDLDEQVSVLGAVADLRALYALSDVVLVASRSESLSLVALESAAQGTPVVCFPGAGGPDELADEGVVIRARSTEDQDMCDLIGSLLLDVETRTRRGQEAREAVRSQRSIESARQVLVEALRTELRAARP